MIEANGSAVQEDSLEESPEPGILRGVIRVLFRVAVAAVLGAILGAAVYVGAPAGLRVLTEPVAQNAADIEILQGDLLLLQERDNREQDRLRAQLNEMGAELTAAQEMLASQSSSLEAMQLSAQELESRLNELELLVGEIESIEVTLQQIEDELAEFRTVDPEVDAAVASLEGKVTILRAMELISRARAELLQGNDGLAEENLTEAIAGLQVLSERGTSPATQEGLESAVQRLQLAQGALAENPEVAIEDLESAWRLLVELSALEEAEIGSS